MGVFDDIKNFNPKKYCNDEGSNPTDRPIKTLVCVSINFLKLIVPLVEYVFILIDFFLSLVLDNKNLVEVAIILSPVIPLLYLFMYFFDSI